MSDLSNNTWQLTALTEALGDLTIRVEESLSIGRGKDNDMVLGSKQVSRNHALLSVLNGKLYIKDLESSNGTFVNGIQIEPNKSKHLNHNDEVRFASFSFQIIDAGTAVAKQPVAEVKDTQVDKIEQTPLQTSAQTQAAQTEVEATPVALASVLPTDAIDSVSAQDERGSDTAVAPSTLTNAPVQPLQPSPEPQTTEAETNPAVSAAPQDETVKKSFNEAVASKHTDDSNSLNNEPVKNESVKLAPTTPEPVSKEPTHKEPIQPIQESATPVADNPMTNDKEQALAATKPINSHDTAPVAQSASNKSGMSWLVWLIVLVVVLAILGWMFGMGDVRT